MEKRTRKIIDAVNQFIDLMKIYLIAHNLKRYSTSVRKKIWVFILFDTDNLVLFIKDNGTTHMFSEEVMDPDDLRELEVVRLNEFLVSELVNYKVTTQDLEKIIFSII